MSQELVSNAVSQLSAGDGLRCQAVAQVGAEQAKSAALAERDVEGEPELRQQR